VKTLRERAYALLARREYARRELFRRLSVDAEVDEVETLLDELEAANQLSDARYAEMLLHAREGRHGSRRLASELREKGVDAETAQGIIEQAREADMQSCRAVWAKRFGVLPADIKERAKQTRFLIGRGFPVGVISKVLNQGGEEMADAVE
jgi:regulatory protein